MNNDYYNIMTYDSVDESFENVLVPVNLRKDYIQKFGTMNTPDFHDLSFWVEEIVVLNNIEKLNKR